MALNDSIAQGLASGWKVTDAATLREDLTREADVVIIGTGAGGGTSAEILAQAGLSVILVEEGRLYHQKDFRMNELDAYARLYQEGLSRVTADGGISIVQGRCVGGSTTVNWTSSFRTPTATLTHWADRFGVKATDAETMRPWFENREARHHIERWATEPNANNTALKVACERLGWSWDIIPRNVKACWNLGYCGMGCPTNAKQGALLTTLPGALEKGAQLFHSLRADRLVMKNGKVDHLLASALDDRANFVTGVQVKLRAKHFVVAASALGSPALLLRSDIPDPHQRIGKRTFLHPVNATIAQMPQQVDPYYGAPQSVYSDEFVWKNGVDGPVGFKLEVPPLHPAFSAGVLPEHGAAEKDAMAGLSHMQSMIALLRDGFHEESQGGEISLRDDGAPLLDYPVSDYLWHGLREAFLRMTEAQFAAGATSVKLIHMDSPVFHSWPEAKQAIRDLPMAIQRVRLFTAHQMGGCGMGENPRESVVNSYGEHHQVANLSVHDASIFPTSIGANPQLSVYALTARNSHQLVKKLT